MATGEIVQLPVADPIAVGAAGSATHRGSGREPKPGRTRSRSAAAEPAPPAAERLAADSAGEPAHRIDVLA
ncbi:hypothetical protein [Nitrospira sp. Kam-Ns4a]